MSRKTFEMEPLALASEDTVAVVVEQAPSVDGDQVECGVFAHESRALVKSSASR